MSAKNLIQTIACTCLLLSANPASAFDILKIHCFRQDKLTDGQIFYSEIHFRKAGTAALRAVPHEGELISYSMNAGVKKYVSGYNLYSISYHDSVISGLTGSAATHADGSFTLVKKGTRITGLWNFSFTNTSGTTINAEFKCMYADIDWDLN